MSYFLTQWGKSCCNTILKEEKQRQRLIKSYSFIVDWVQVAQNLLNEKQIGTSLWTTGLWGLCESALILSELIYFFPIESNKLFEVVAWGISIYIKTGENDISKKVCRLLYGGALTKYWPSISDMTTIAGVLQN